MCIYRNQSLKIKGFKSLYDDKKRTEIRAIEDKILRKILRETLWTMKNSSIYFSNQMQKTCLQFLGRNQNK